MQRTKGVLPEFAPVDKETVHARVYLELRTALMTGAFAPGQSVTIRSLAEAFGTSAMPVREALRRLVAEQALQILPNRSVIVPLMSRAKLDELRRVRVVLEGMAAEQAATHVTPEEIDKLARLIDEMHPMAMSSDTKGYLATNQDFHFTIYRAARSQVLIPMIESLWLQIGPFLNLLLNDRAIAEMFAVKHHAAALEALREGDGRGAREAIAGDISEAADILLDLVDADGDFLEADESRAAR